VLVSEDANLRVKAYAAEVASVDCRTLEGILSSAKLM
jgi:predicted ribonuclease YlaK